MNCTSQDKMLTTDGDTPHGYNKKWSCFHIRVRGPKGSVRKVLFKMSEMFVKDKFPILCSVFHVRRQRRRPNNVHERFDSPASRIKSLILSNALGVQWKIPRHDIHTNTQHVSESSFLLHLNNDGTQGSRLSPRNELLRVTAEWF